MARPKKTELVDQAIDHIDEKEFFEEQVSTEFNEIKKNPKFTGTVRSVICSANQGFRNFKIITLTIENGKVTSQALSDNYAAFEAIARLDLLTQMDTIRLNNNWEDGKAWFGSP